MTFTGGSKKIDRREFLKALSSKLGGRIRSYSLVQGGRVAEKKIAGTRVAHIDIAQCLAWGGMSCQACYIACPLRDQAIQVVDQKPEIVTSLCNGCGECEIACQTVNHTLAIEMVGR